MPWPEFRVPLFRKDSGIADIPGARIGAVLTAAAAALYYATYVDRGFNLADDGNYAQIVYELSQGADPHDIRYHYGLGWFKFGQLAFALTGPSYLTAEAVLFLFMAVTAGFVFATVARLTRSLPLAAAAGLLAGLVPAFPPTAFYGAGTLFNLFAQSGMALRWRTLTARAVVPGALALAVTFQLRPDFGYIFAPSFVALLVLSGWAQGGRRLAALAGAAAATFVLAHVPLLLDALPNGYVDLILADYLRYPGAMLRFVTAGLGQSSLGPNGAGTLLALPPVSALWNGPPILAAMAFAVYAPPVGIAGFVLVQAGALLRGEAAEGRVSDRLVRAGVLLTGAAASLPHYLLFRPDLPHVANFMPGFIVLAAVLAWELAGGDLATLRRTRPRPAGLAAAGVVLAGLGVYGWIGLTYPGTGSTVLAYGRDQGLTLAGGERVYVTAEDKAYLDELRRLVEENARPDEPIVCLPYCPGVAVLARRRMLLREYYVDDAFLVTDPGWLDRTIERTRAARPPVVVIIDWAINGTDISRFPVWGRRYLDFLEAEGYRRVDVREAAVYLRPAP